MVGACEARACVRVCVCGYGGTEVHRYVLVGGGGREGIGVEGRDGVRARGRS
jgi:hypothetical protein